VPVAELHLSPETLGKISRYIDVTRAALLFGNRALLVEGMAEALLIPVIAQRIVLKGNRDALLRFRGAVVIPIDGVDFKPYVEILLRRHSGFNICERVVIVTDRDPALQGNRLEDLQELAKAIGSAENLHVFVNRDTLESDLFADGNEALLKDAFLALHPRSGDDWEGRVASQPLDNRPDAFRSLIEAKRTRKGDLAQELARLIDTGRQLKVPQYLVDGITKIAAP
jgi:putative ATP-dependent endonuclease of OLD family